MRRVFLIVLDSVGVGGAPDAAAFGDAGANTLRAAFESGELFVPNLEALGLGLVPGAEFLKAPPSPLASYGVLTERSAGKDTTTGHWELAGLISREPMPTFPSGFPPALVESLTRECGRRFLCNLPYSGTEVIRDFGEEHLVSGSPILYTSADSVLQIAAHTDVIPLEELYRICRVARRLCVGEYAVGRIIARPFRGEPGNFVRTPDRRDFSLAPSGETMLDRLSDEGLSVLSVGKISDIFAGRGITESYPEHGNADCIARLLALARRDFRGLCFVNLVDFDTLYGHRNDAAGYARALSEFDRALSLLLPLLNREDALLITADHGCDPSDESTDHTRERVPLLVYGEALAPRSFGAQLGFASVAQTVCELLGVSAPYPSPSVFDGGVEMKKEEMG